MAEFLARIAVTLVCTAFYFVAGARMLGAMQQSGYRNAKFYAWLKRKDNLWYNRLCLLFLMLLLSCALTALCFSFAGAKIARLISFVPFVFFLLLFCITEGKSPLKVKTSPTGRLKRLAAVYAFVLAVAVYVFVAACGAADKAAGKEAVSLFIYLPLSAFPLLLPVLFALSNAISCLFETPRNNRFIKKAAARLQKERVRGLIVIAVTGSYGKTSVKNILAEILSQKYRVVATPQSYNTPLGIAKSAFLEELSSADVFIAEFGAAKAGDIKELCNLVTPDYGVFTGVCRQHTATFGGEEQIFEEKKILIERAKNKVVCGGDIYAKFGDKLSAELLQKCIFVPQNAVQNVGGFPFKTEFDLSLPPVSNAVNGEENGDKNVRRRVSVPLLGRGAAENIALAAYLSAKLSLTAEEIFKGINNVRPVPHRLNLLQENGVYVLDDAYNANEKSAAQAIEVLSAFEGKKYAVTPGITETDEKYREINRKIGESLADLDGVFVHRSAEDVKEGFLQAGGNEEKLRVYATLEEVQKVLSSLLSAGDAVLFLNDLPDVY